MAENGEIKVHERMYGRFMGVLKVSTVACFVIAAIVVWLIAPK